MTILATIIVLGVLIFVHELGHFAAAKAVGIGVERFSIGFGPKLLGFVHGQTEYVLSAIPLGGYVKMQGMDDELMEELEGGKTSSGDRDPSKDYDSKSVLARAFVISAGVIMNFLFAFAAYAYTVGVIGFAEQNTTRIGDINGELIPAGAGALGQLQVGSEIVSVGGTEVAHWGEVRNGLFEAPTGPLTIETRSPAATVEIRVPASEEERARLASALRFWLEPEFGQVVPGSAADGAGLEAGDRVVAIDGQAVETWWEMVDLVSARPDVATEFTIERSGGRLTRTVTPEPVEVADAVNGGSITVGRIGVVEPVDPDRVVYERVPPGEAIVYGYRRTVEVSGDILSFLGGLFTGAVNPRDMGSIVTIGAASGRAAEMGLQAFLGFMALFSINLAILNLLPIPVLDGGHLVFLAIEALRGQALSVKQRLRWSNVGFVVIMGIMVFALFNDFLRLVGL